MQSFEMGVRLFAACKTRPSYYGEREDNKVCSAKPGECRYNSDHYTPGMNDEKSWSLPIAGEKCNSRCLYLISIEGKPTMDKTKNTNQKRIRSIGTTKSRVNHEFIAKALGAEKTEVVINTKQNPMTLFALRRHIAKNLDPVEEDPH